MNEIVFRRMVQQQLAAPSFPTPAQVVGWLGAVQAQEYESAKWALQLRLPRPAAQAIEQAFQDGQILRTHVLRPTWHFVTPADIRWLQQLTAPRVKAALASSDRMLGLDEDLRRRAFRAIDQELRGRQMTRAELAGVLAGVGIDASGQRLAHLVMHAELDCLLCSGPRRGSQHTYMLLEERVPPQPDRTREEALAELAHRYFNSRGPAQVRDFSWWSGLTMVDARAAIALLTDLRGETLDGKTWYALPNERLTALEQAPLALLLPNYDELLISYSDRGDIVDPARVRDVLFSFASGSILLDGQIAGLWKRSVDRRSASIAITPFRALLPAEQGAVDEAARRYEEFIGLPVTVAW
jgi:hypothetical protein